MKTYDEWKAEQNPVYAYIRQTAEQQYRTAHAQRTKLGIARAKAKKGGCNGPGHLRKQ